MTYADMTLDQLFDELRDAAMAEFAADTIETLPAQAAAADREGFVIDEIMKRPGQEERFRAMLDDPHPRMRYRAALQMKAVDPHAALRVFHALRNAHGACSDIALLQIFMLRRQGIV